ncbi:MAG: cytochrome c [Peptococcaceae bacterium]|nr:cytochrome c [Peptococcaceae bacterium]
MANKRNLVLILGFTLLFLVAITASAFASNGITPAATAPSNGNTTPGPAASMFGNVQNGQQTFTANCSSCHGQAGQPSNKSFPGLTNVTNANGTYSIDPALYDPNPAIFAKNIDAFVQHGSSPSGVPAAMPAWGDTKALTQTQIADAEAYVMSLSDVNWPTLILNGTTLSGSNFTSGGTVQVYQNGKAVGSAITPVNGKFSLTVNIPTAQSGVFSANYATLNVPGVYPNGDKTQAQIGLDGSKGASDVVAKVNYGSSVATSNMPKTGSNSIVLAMLGMILAVLGAVLVMRKPALQKQS